MTLWRWLNMCKVVLVSHLVTYSRNILWCIIWRNFSKLPFDTYPGRIIVLIATRKLSCEVKTGEKNGHKMKEHWWSSKYINHFHAVIVFQFKKWVVDFICIYACVCIFSLSCFHLLLCNKFLPNTIYTNVMCHRLSAVRVEQKQNVRKNLDITNINDSICIDCNHLTRLSAHTALTTNIWQTFEMISPSISNCNFNARSLSGLFKIEML